MDSNSVRRMILQTKSLPTISSTLYHIIECVNDETTSANDLKSIILRDQSISAKVLNVANSAWFGLSRKVEDISRAIVVLGFDTVLEIAMYVSFSTFIHEASRSTSFDPEKFWMHSIAASESAKMVSKDLSVTTGEIAVLIGLLHDIGKVMVNYLYPREYGAVLDEARETNESLELIEKQKLGFDHAEVGEWLGEKWKFPLRLTACVRYHHVPGAGDTQFRNEVFLASLANNLAKTSNIGFSGNGNTLLNANSYKTGLRITNDMITGWVGRLAEEEEKIRSFAYHMK